MAILYSGTEGTCQWTIDDQGHLYIGSGVINHNTNRADDWSWYQYRSEIISVSSGNVSWNIGANAFYMFDNFYVATSFDLSNFDTSNVINMNSMFFACNKLTSLDLSNFDTSNVTDMTYMFSSCHRLVSLNLSTFDTNKVKSMPWMFRYCNNLTTIIVSNKWTVASVTDSRNMFEGCSSLIGEQETTYNSSHTNASYARIDGGPSNPGYLTNIDSCPCYASFNSENGELRIFRDVEGKYTKKQVIDSTTYWPNIESITGNNAPPWYSDNFSPDITSVKIINIYKPKTAYRLFSNCSSLVSLDLSNLDTSEVISMQAMFENCWLLNSLDLSNFNTSKVIYMAGMFNGCGSLTSLDLSNFNTSNVINMGGMFYSCQSLTSLNLLSFDTNGVKRMDSMFAQCESLTSLDLSSFNTSQVVNMSNMFGYCEGLTTITMSSNFRTDQVTNMSTMFDSCQSLAFLELSSFNTSNVTNMGSMFRYCQSLISLDISNFNTSNVSDMNSMFTNCINLTSLNLPEDFASNTIYFSSVFELDAKLTQLNITKMHLEKVEDLYHTFRKCSLSLNLVVGNVNLTSGTSAFEDSTGTFYIIDSTKSNTSWKTVASEYNNVFYNIDGAFLPAYKLNAIRGSVIDSVWVSDEGGDSIQFTYNAGDITLISNIPEGFSCTNYSIIVKENNITISNEWTWENNTYILELQDLSKAHQYVMELTYSFTDENDNTYTKTVNQLISIAEPYALLDFRAGGRGIAVGKLSERNGFDIAFPVSIGEGLTPPEDWNYFLSKDVEVNNSKTYYTYDEQTGEYNEVSNPTTESPVEQGYYERERSVDLKNYQLLIGKYNILKEDALFIIGNGTNEEPSNLMTIGESGLQLYAGEQLQIADIGYKEGNNSGVVTKIPCYTFGNPFNINDFAEYNNSTAYNAGDIVSYNDKIYMLWSYNGRSGSPPPGNGWQLCPAKYSFMEGNKCVVSDTCGHAEGDQTRVGGAYGHAEGRYSVADGGTSHAEGIGTVAMGTASHTQNYYTRTGNFYQTAMGKYNEIDGNAALMIGNGTSDNNRSNAMTVDWNGNIVAAGGLTLKNHSSQVGTQKKTYLSTATSVGSGAGNAKSLCSLELEAGTWIIVYGARFPSNSTGYRVVNMSTTQNDQSLMQVTNAVNGSYTQTRTSLVVTVSSKTTYYLSVYHTAGTSLTMPATGNDYGNFMTATRLV